ncbi:hypothetical protein E2C01_065168 [Portunus trituberculatus]|uniref:Uncharacterized protein n=1 Tax=Portunus trituberculatus TaxID=210409 RepID=A0A5B7HLT5_PORTR|nr:hypothetical protein [Portunus trituberculatus]
MQNIRDKAKAVSTTTATTTTYKCHKGLGDCNTRNSSKSRVALHFGQLDAIFVSLFGVSRGSWSGKCD